MSTPGFNLSDSVYERLLRDRIIFLGTQVDDEIANKTVRPKSSSCPPKTPPATFRSTLIPPAAPSPQAWPFTTP